MPTRTIYPYNVASNAIELRLLDPEDPTNPDLDLEWVSSQVAADEPPRLDLKAHADWRRLAFRVEARLDAKHLEHVLPPRADYRQDTSMLVSVRCPRTKVRYPIELDADASEECRWFGDLEFDRRDVASRLEFHPLLHRRTQIPASAEVPAGVTRRRGALLSFGRPTSATIDETERRPEGWVKIRWEDFRASKNHWRRGNSETLYFLEVDPEEPVLWLNERYKQIRALLFEQNPLGPTGAMHHMFVASIAETVWTQLFNAALGSVERPVGGGELALPGGWRGDLLRTYLPRLFPDIDDNDEALGRAVAMSESGDELGALVGLVTTVTQTLVRSERLFRDAIRCVETSSSLARG